MTTSSEIRENKSLLNVSKPATSSSLVISTGSSSTLSVPPKVTSDRYLMPTAEIYSSKATMSRRTSSDTQSPSQSDSASASARTSGIANGYAGGKTRLEEPKAKVEERVVAATDDFDVQSVINERRPPKLKTTHGGAAASATTSVASDQYSALIRGEGYTHIYVTTDDRSDDVPSPCGNVSESTGTGSLSVIGSISAGGSISAATGSISSGSGSAGRNGTGGGGGVHIGEGGAIGADVRIYVDDTDSASSNNGQRRRRRDGDALRDDETLDASTTVSSIATMRDGCGGNGSVGGNGSGSGKETPDERLSSSGRQLDPS